MSGNRPVASTKGSRTSICDHDYYGPLIDSYIKSILKSGLLLDEDVEVVLSISRFRNFPERRGYRPSLSILASIISVLGSSILAKKLRLPVLVIPAIVVTVHSVVFEFKKEKRKQDNTKIVDKLVEVLKSIQALNKNIILYMKTRSDLGKAKEESCFIFSDNNVEEFMRTFLQSNCDITNFLIENMRIFITYSSELKEDFSILEEIQSSHILVNEDLDGIDKCLLCAQKIYDINVLMFSKLLSYIGISLNSKTILASNVVTIINEIIPNILKTLQKHRDITKQQFVSLRLSSTKKSELKLQSNAKKRKNITSKLETTLICSINNLSIILEKSQNILDKVENQSEEQLPQLSNDIIDLRNHTYATYESLDLLCRLYGIISNSNLPTSINKPKVTNTSPSKIVSTVNYDDEIEPIEEKYEIYIGSDLTTEEHPSTHYEDQSTEYLSLMLQELKQSLKQHERFIEAKNKRGEEDDEEIVKRDRQEKKKSPPKFDLTAVNDYKPKTVLEDGNVIDLPLQPPPPPPPLPSFNLEDLERETGQINARSMLDNIKVLSGQRRVQEDVFGGADDVSTDSE